MNNFREYRLKSGLSAQEAATEMGIGITTMFNWEKGRTKPNYEKVLKMCEMYKTDPNSLLGFEAK